MRSRSMFVTSFIKGFPAISIAVIILLMASCKKENSTGATNAIPVNLKMISSGYAAGAATRVEIYADENLYVGYNKLYITLYDSASGSRITQAQISLNTMMTTGMTGPVENPAGTNALNGLFDAAAVFISTGSWTINTMIKNTTSNASGSFSTTSNVVQPSPARAYSVTTADSSNLFVSMVQPLSPQLGVNSFELVVDRQINSTSYTPDSTYMIAINPTMPSMSGMGSPNNVNPIYTGSGHYAGKVDFIMGGGWQIFVDLLHNGMVSDTSHYFALNL